MDHSTTEKRTKTLTLVGIALIILMTLTKIVPSSNIAGYSVFVGLAFFFIVEAVAKTPGAESGLRFKSFFADVKKPGVLIWMLLPIVSCLATILIGTLLFNDAFVNHVVGRTSSVLSFNQIPLLVGQVVITALGEEIAYRGFFVGKAMKLFPFWPCALVSAAVFASGHIAAGNFGLVLFDIVTILIDGIIYAVIYKKTGNCLVSAVAHILCNAVGIAVALFFF